MSPIQVDDRARLGKRAAKSVHRASSVYSYRPSIWAIVTNSPRLHALCDQHQQRSLVT